MKNLILLFFTLCICGLSQGAIFYISPSGNDVSGNGTMANPWKTLKKATSTVTTSGDVIHVMAGTYVETSESNLAIGVDIEGEGATTTIIQSTLTSNNTPLLNLSSTPGTNGNQSISGVKLDGRYVSESNKGTFWGLLVEGRGNVEVYNCVITGFFDRGVIFSSAIGFSNSAPSVYAVGNKFHDNTLSNSSTYYGGYGTGCLNLHGQQDMLIYNNTLQQNERGYW